MIIGMVLKMKLGKYYQCMKYKFKGTPLERRTKALESMTTENLNVEFS